MNRITREQAIKEVGLNAVLKLESENVDYTNRVTGNNWVEFSARVEAVDKDGEKVKLVMYVMVSKDELDSCDELDMVNWEAAISDAEFDII